MEPTDSVVGHPVDHRRFRAHTRERVGFDACGGVHEAGLRCVHNNPRGAPKSHF